MTTTIFIIIQQKKKKEKKSSQTFGKEKFTISASSRSQIWMLKYLNNNQFYLTIKNHCLLQLGGGVYFLSF